MGKFKQFCSVIIVSLTVLISSSAVQAEHFPSSDVVTVKKGDTLYGIAKKYHTSVSSLQQLNELDDTIIYPGQKLILFEKEKVFHKVMAGSFIEKDNAIKQVSFLNHSDIEAIITENIINGKTYYRVQAGAFINEDNALEHLQTVKEAGIFDAYILTVNPSEENDEKVGD